MTRTKRGHPSGGSTFFPVVARSPSGGSTDTREETWKGGKRRSGNGSRTQRSRRPSRVRHPERNRAIPYRRPSVFSERYSSAAPKRFASVQAGFTGSSEGRVASPPRGNCPTARGLARLTNVPFVGRQLWRAYGNRGGRGIWQSRLAIQCALRERRARTAWTRCPTSHPSE